jgi:hypothetical protein
MPSLECLIVKTRLFGKDTFVYHKGHERGQGSEILAITTSKLPGRLTPTLSLLHPALSPIRAASVVQSCAADRESLQSLFR